MTPERVLIYRIGQIGDTVIALPAMWAVRKHFPNAHLCLLTDSHLGNNHVSALQVLPEKGLVDDYITYSVNYSGINLKILLSLLPELRRRRFDTLVYLAPRLRTRWKILRDLTFFRAAGIQCFLGHNGFKPLPRANSGSSLPAVQHETDHLLYRLSLSGIPVPPPGKGSMDLGLTSEEYEEAKIWLAMRLGNQFAHAPVVAIGPSSKAPSKVWPEERFSTLGKQLIRELEIYPIVFGGSEGRDLGQRLIRLWGIGANAAGSLNVRQAAAVLFLCRMYVGNDNGTMHLAAASGIRCVAIFSAKDWPGRWYPYGKHHIVLRSSVPCEGCLLTECLERKSICLEQISVGDVMAACRAALREKAPTDLIL